MADLHHIRAQTMGYYNETGGLASTGSTYWDADHNTTAFSPIGASADFVLEKIENDNMVYDADDKNQMIPGLRSKSKFSFGVPLAGSGSTVASGSVYTATLLSTFLRWSMGGQVLSTRCTINGGTAANPTVNNGSLVSVGDVLAFTSASNGGYAEARQVVAKTGNTLTVEPPLSFTPTAGLDAYACAANYIDIDSAVDYTDTQYDTFTLVFKGQHQNDVWIGKGCKAAPKFSNWNAGQKPMVTFDGMAADFLSPDQIANKPAFTGTIYNHTPITVQAGSNSKFFYTTYGNTSAVATEPTFNIDLDLGLEWGAIDACSGGTEGVFNYIAQFPSKPKLSVTLLHSGTLYPTEYSTDVLKSCVYQVGNVPGRIFGFLIKKMQEVEEPKRVDANGLIAMQRTYAPIHTVTSASLSGDQKYVMRASVVFFSC